ncbi:MAG: hypothetical protein AAF664_00455, partial [Planctomycetota bacterium]
VGIYGGIPSMQSQPRRGESDSNSDGGVASYRTGGSTNGSAGSLETANAIGTRGDSVGTVPSRYRASVSNYFRTLAEEIGDPQ